jgi:hypothetical protein
VEDIQAHLQWLGKAKFKHVFREAILVAHGLAISQILSSWMKIHRASGIILREEVHPIS